MMKFGYKFSNLLGTVYSGGNIVFTPDGNSVISPVGNRLTVFDLVNHSSITLPIETHRDIKIIALSPNGKILIASDENGYTAIINIQRHVQLGECKFRETPSAIEFSPNGSMVAFGVDRRVYIYKSPIVQKSLNPMVRLSLFQHSQKIVSLDWSNDSKKLLIACKGGTLFVREGNERPHLFQVQGSQPVKAFFGDKDSKKIFAVSKKGLVQWRYMSDEEIKQQQKEKALLEGNTDGQDEVFVTTESNDNESTTNGRKKRKGRWIYTSFNRFETSQSVRVKSCQYHKVGGLLVIGLSNGLFTLHQMPDYQELYRLNISNQAITAVAFNNTGEWMAFASKELGQLLVWEWRSETYILKQQGHSYNMSTMAYSPDGQTIATGGDDGKLKIWNTTSGYCFVTFSEHEAPLTAVRYSPVASQSVVFSASLDGTVRAFDLLRYRNFRTFVSPNKSQFSSLAIDQAGEIVVAGCIDTFEIYVWSVRTGRLTDVLSGHTAPVSSLSFDPATSSLASGSWDKQVRVWDLFEDGATKETIINKTDILAVSYSPDGSRFAVSTLDGSIQIFETSNWTQVGIIDGRHDIMGGRSAADLKQVKNNASGRAFTRISFTPNGQCIVAGGDSKYICIYHVEQQILLKKYQISRNMSLDGIFDNHTWSKVSEFGHIDMMEDDYEDDEKRHDHSMPGVKRGDLAKRSTSKKIKTYDLAVSPTGRAWAATTTEGLMIYSLDENLFFDPTDLSLDINPESIRSTLNDKEYLKALVMSLKLNEKPLIEEVFESIPINHIAFVCHEFPQYYLKNFIKFISYIFERKPHLEFQMTWILYLLTYHGKYFKSNSLSMIEPLRNLQKCLVQNYTNLSQVCDDNKYTLDYFEQMSIFSSEKKLMQIKVEKEEAEASDEEMEDEDDEDEDDDENGQDFDENDMDDNYTIEDDEDEEEEEDESEEEQKSRAKKVKSK